MTPMGAKIHIVIALTVPLFAFGLNVPAQAEESAAMESDDAHSVESVIADYYSALNSHDAARVLAFLSPDFRLHFSGSDFALGRDQLETALGWDIGTNANTAFELEDVTDDGAVIRTVEQNDFLRLLGIGPLHARVSIRLSPNGLIDEMTHESLVVPGVEGLDRLHDRLSPAVEWLRQSHAQDLEAIYPNGQLAYTRESGERWVKLLKEWQSARTD